MLIDLPKTTIIDRIIPKDRFNFSDATKINRIRWAGKLATNTINLPSKNELEVEIFSVEIDEFDADVLLKIKAAIPHEILYIVNETKAAVIVNDVLYERTFTEKIQIVGLTIEEVRDNFIRQILEITDTSKPIKQQVAQLEAIRELQKQIDKLNQKIGREVQVNRKQRLARERYNLEQQLKQLSTQ
ncbi:MAG: DUF4391 domain-containing protein [Lactobacillaceae bacterium]|jgi:hypothetical protein|nr:DUF4391 domain-containing protein [Lactobacillaceae bacterium]